MTTEDVIFKIIKVETGSINESDVKLSLSDPNTVIVGFHVQEDANIKNLNEYDSLTIMTFDIIYKLTEWLEELYEKRRIKKQIDTVQGTLKVIKDFSRQKDLTLIGGAIITGMISVDETCKIKEKDGTEIGRGKIFGIQQGKMDAKRVSGEGIECGMMIKTKVDIAPGNIIETFISETK
jgi:translation initiation factor IF-2